uniref:Uncharacterized protein n=1 Tax=Anguilla anguilla TaxID=7936 RepID=A0A0E9QB52_ANGAN
MADFSLNLPFLLIDSQLTPRKRKTAFFYFPLSSWLNVG